MTFSVLQHRTATPGNYPSPNSAVAGLLYLNTYDGTLSFQKSVAGANSIVMLSSMPPATANALTNPVTISLSGAATGSQTFQGNSSITIPVVLANSGVSVGTYNTVSVDQYGRVVSGSNVGGSSGNFTATGDVSGTESANAITLTLATVNSSPGSYGTTGTAHPNITVDAKGRITAISTTAIAFPVVSVAGRTGAVVLANTDITNALGYTPVAATSLGVANGVATLDSTSRLTVSQLPTSVVGGLKYQGIWNASTNSPSLASGTGTQGYVYVVSTAGTTTLDGISSWGIGDWAVFGGAGTWEKLDGQATEVVSVAGRTGAVVLSASDVSGVLATPLVVSGDVSGTSTGNTVSVSLSASGATAGTYFGSLVVNSKGLITNSVAINDIGVAGFTSGVLDGGSY
jgi:hypothetical protein